MQTYDRPEVPLVALEDPQCRYESAIDFWPTEWIRSFYDPMRLECRIARPFVLPGQWLPVHYTLHDDVDWWNHLDGRPVKLMNGIKQ